MKFRLFIQTLFITIFSFYNLAQESFEFSLAQPTVFQEGGFEKKHEGIYVSEKNASLSYEITENDILIHFTQYENMSKEYMDSDLKLYVINELLYGLSEKPIPVVLENGRYYFGFIKTTSLKENKAIIRKVDSYNYVINLLDNGVFSPQLLQFVGRSLRISDFNYSTDKEIKLLRRMTDEKIVTDAMTHYRLNPNQKGWEKLISKGFFPEENVFFKATIEN